MNVVAPLPPTDLAQVQARLASVEAQNQALRTENQLLRDKIQALLRRYFGSPKNESLDPAQLQLLLSGLVALVPAIALPDGSIASPFLTLFLTMHHPIHLQSEAQPRSGYCSLRFACPSNLRIAAMSTASASGVVFDEVGWVS